MNELTWDLKPHHGSYREVERPFNMAYPHSPGCRDTVFP